MKSDHLALPFEDIAYCNLRPSRVAFRQEVRGLVLVSSQMAETNVVLHANDVADWAKADGFPCTQKAVCVWPAIKAETNRIGLKNPPNLPKRGQTGSGFFISDNCFPFAVPSALIS